MQSPIMRLPAGQSLQTLSEMVLEHMVRLGDMVMQTKAWAGMANGVKAKAEKERHGKCRPGKVRCNRSAHEAGRPRCGLVRLWRECGGVGRSEDGLGPTLRSPPTYRLCLSLSIPTPISLQQQTTKFRLFFIIIIYLFILFL